MEAKNFCRDDAFAVKTYYTTITPDDAKRMLEKNYTMNRPIRKEIVKRYAYDMQNGLWNPYAAEPITLTQDGTVVNGQHRLAAIVKADIPVLCEIRTGVPESSYYAFDCGLKRTAGDGLGIKNLTNVIAISRAMMAIALNPEITYPTSFLVQQTKQKHYSSASVVQYYTEFESRHPQMIQAAIQFAREKTSIMTGWNRTAIALSAVAMQLTDMEMYQEFCNAVRNEKDVRESALSYRYWATRNAMYKQDYENRYIEWCAAANLWRELHGLPGKKFYYNHSNPRKNRSELIGFRPAMFDVLGYCNEKNGGD